MKTQDKCLIPLPEGWECTQEGGHEGPCAAILTPENEAPLWREKVGDVYRCILTGNLIITEGKKSRMLVVSEADTFFSENYNCVEEGFRRELKKWKSEIV